MYSTCNLSKKCHTYFIQARHNPNKMFLMMLHIIYSQHHLCLKTVRMAPPSVRHPPPSIQTASYTSSLRIKLLSHTLLITHFPTLTSPASLADPPFFPVPSHAPSHRMVLVVLSHRMGRGSRGWEKLVLNVSRRTHRAAQLSSCWEHSGKHPVQVVQVLLPDKLCPDPLQPFLRAGIVPRGESSHAGRPTAGSHLLGIFRGVGWGVGGGAEQLACQASWVGQSAQRGKGGEW